MEYLTNNKKGFKLVVLGYSLIALLIMLSLITLGTANITLIDVLRIVGKKIPFIGHYIDDSGIREAYKIIVLNLRFPRVIMAFIVGAGLASSGLIFQGVFRNPMADPYVLGVSSGAAFGATIVIILGINFTFFTFSFVSIGAFIGAALTTMFVFTIASFHKSKSTTILLLTGIAISFFLSSFISLLMTLNRDLIENIFFWTMGSVSTATWDKVGSIIIGNIIGIAIFIYYSTELNIILTGESNAVALGVNVKRVRKILLYTASLVSALAVSVSGIIGFVGLIVPHAVRLVIGADNRKLLPMTIISGGIFLAVSDGIARSIVPPMEIPLGVITAFIGTPYFIFLLIRKRYR
ncbi:MAG: iron ABC transporter permease [Clostridiales bacterium]|nr:iron ABC transporter permease [Clostridiales bacterium]